MKTIDLSEEAASDFSGKAEKNCCILPEYGYNVEENRKETKIWTELTSLLKWRPSFSTRRTSLLPASGKAKKTKSKFLAVSSIIGSAFLIQTVFAV